MGRIFWTTVIVLGSIAMIRSIEIPGMVRVDIRWAALAVCWLFAFTVARQIMKTALPCTMALRPGAIPMLTDALEECLERAEEPLVGRVDSIITGGLTHALGRDWATRILFGET